MSSSNSSTRIDETAGGASPQTLNDPRSNTASVLPAELLITIFQFACPSSSSRYSQRAFLDGHDSEISSLKPAVILSGVSRHWRQVALSTSELWQVLEVRCRDKMSYQAHSWISLLKLCVDRSLSSVDVSIDWSMVEGSLMHDDIGALSHPKAPGLHLDQLGWAVFVTYPHAIRKLLLIEVADEWPWSASTLTSFTHMEEFCVEGVEGAPMVERNIDVSAFRNALGTRLTALDLECLPYDLCVEVLLHHCPNLVRCRSLFPTKMPVTRVGDDQRITLPHLEWLDWEAMPTRDTLRFGKVSMPALRGLRWYDDGMWSHDWVATSELATTLSRLLFSATMLKELELTLLSEHIPSLPQIFEAASGVQKLIINGSYHDLLSTPSLLSPLMQRSTTILLPALHTLLVQVAPIPSVSTRQRQQSVKVANDLLTIVKQRWEYGLASRFQIALDFGQEWSEEVRERFNDFVQDGLQLDIRIASHQWL
ncbi:hypothetical protein AN958_06320 [Leucoagaricus sp. SymC.cos]|nr:hypothetical protein AN958_06320 [Leucoagaricus sp. SymC.cos]